MADNVTADPGTGGATFAADDILGIHYPRTKLVIGADGTNDGDISAANPLPVTGTVALGATDNAVLDAIAASLALIDNSIATGSELQVDVVAALPAGTNNIGDVDVLTLPALAAGTNNIGDVDVLSVIPGTGATNLGKAIDTAAGATDTGIAALAVRDDALTTLTPIDGDFVPLRVDSTGALWVSPVAGSAEKVDDAAFTLASDSVVMVGAIRDDSLATLTAVEGDAVPLRVSSTGALHVTGGGGGTEYTEDVATANPIVGTATMMERDDALSALTPIEGDWAAMRCDANGALWVAATDGGGTLTVDGTVAVTGVATAANQTTIIGHVDGIEALLATIDGDTSNLSVVGGGTEATAIRVTIASDSTGVLSIDDNGAAITVDGTVAVTNAGTFATQVDGAALTALQLIDNSIVAHDAAISGATGVSVIGLNARSSEPTAVASADATQALATLLGKQVVIPYAIPASTWSYASPAAVADTADDEAKAAGAAGVRNYITGVQVFNGHDTVGTEVVIKDGSTVLWRGWAEETGGGCSARFDPPLRGTAATAVNVANITTGSATYFNLQGFVASE